MGKLQAKVNDLCTGNSLIVDGGYTAQTYFYIKKSTQTQSGFSISF